MWHHMCIGSWGEPSQGCWLPVRRCRPLFPGVSNQCNVRARGPVINSLQAEVKRMVT